MKELLEAVSPWIAVIAAVVAGFVTFRNQMRLKAFELLLARRMELLKEIEERIGFYRTVLNELENGQMGERADEFAKTNFHDSLVLFHKAKGMALGPTADILIDTYWGVSKEPILDGKPLTVETVRSLLTRKINGLVAYYGFAHSRISGEIEFLTLSNLDKAKRLLGIRERLKVKRADSRTKVV